MVLCWIALPVFLFLSIFSVKYRRLTAEALDCIWRTAIFRPCRSNLDERLRSDITGKLIDRNPRLARFFYNNYKLISFIFIALMLVSAYLTGAGVYNYIKHGNCNGADSKTFCVINAALGKQNFNNIVPPNKTSLECLNQSLQLKNDS